MMRDSAGGRADGLTTIVTLPATPTEPSRPIARLIPFAPDRIAPALRAKRLAAFVRRARRFPDHRQIFLHPRPGRRWAVLFCYQPEPGPIDPGHRFTIARLQAEGFAVLVVLAARDPAQGDGYAALGLDGLIVKGLSGYDFSGYTLGLQALVAAFGTVDVLVMNDSVLGPFHPLVPLIDSAPWAFTGFLSNNGVEPHFNSFAFFIRGADRRFLRRMRSVFLDRVAFDGQSPVAYLQETRMARVAARHYSAGSLFGPVSRQDMTFHYLENPEGLVEIGYPFLKKSIFTKFADTFDQHHYATLLARLGHDPLA